MTILCHCPSKTRYSYTQSHTCKELTGQVIITYLCLSHSQASKHAFCLIILCRIIENQSYKNINVILLVQSTSGKYKIAMKLQCQFTQTTNDKLIKLVNSAGENWTFDHVSKNKIKKFLKIVLHVLFIKRPQQDP